MGSLLQFLFWLRFGYSPWAELVRTETGIEDIVFGFSNNDMRVRKEMVYQSSVQQEMNKVAEAKDSLAGIAELARQLQEAIEEKLSCL
ncbi:MAG: hypothetical protein ACI4AB_07055 [Acetatifactor sp.]